LREGASWNSYAIDEWQLPFFNLIPGCEATLRIAKGRFDFLPFLVAIARRATLQRHLKLADFTGSPQFVGLAI
jgi:hypothetical protein